MPVMLGDIGERHGDFAVFLRQRGEDFCTVTV